MNVLVVGPRTPDYLHSCLWDGLQELLGWENVVDGVRSPWLYAGGWIHAPQEDHDFGGRDVLEMIAGTRPARWLPRDEGFDALVIHSSFNREGTHEDLERFRQGLKPGGRVAYVEGWDSARHIVRPPPWVDVIFRKEIDPRVDYPYACQHLGFAAPARWFEGMKPVAERTLDVFWMGSPWTCHPDHPVRRDMLAAVFQAQKQRVRVLLSSADLGLEFYWKCLRDSKLALCPAAADDADSLRTYEAVAAGALPVFVGYPAHRRDHWFPEALDCTPATLARHVEEALSGDLTYRQTRVQELARTHHTTRARALQMLQALGVEIPHDS